jgi:transposase
MSETSVLEKLKENATEKLTLAKGLQTEFEGKLSAFRDYYCAVPDDLRGNVYDSDAAKKLLKELKLKHDAEKPANGKSSRGKVTDEQIVNFVGTGKTTAEVATAFQWGYQNAYQRLKKSGKLKKVKKLWLKKV